MIFRTLTAAFAAASLTLSAAHAADSEGRYAVDGPAGQVCSAYLETAKDKQSREFTIIAGWTLGFVSAHNRLMEDTFDLTPWQSVEVLLLQVENFCRANPTARFEQAVVELIKFMTPNRMTETADSLQFTHDGKAVIIYRSVLDDAAAALTAKGHATDGTPESMAAAFTAYQEEMGFTVTGLPDMTTLFNLFRD